MALSVIPSSLLCLTMTSFFALIALGCHPTQSVWYLRKKFFACLQMKQRQTDNCIFFVLTWTRTLPDKLSDSLDVVWLFFSVFAGSITDAQIGCSGERFDLSDILRLVSSPSISRLVYASSWRSCRSYIQAQVFIHIPKSTIVGTVLVLFTYLHLFECKNSDISARWSEV